MKKLYVLLFSIFLFPLTLLSQPTLDYYLPSGVSYNPDIPTPAEVVGHEVGEWHITHDKLVQYMYALAESSDRVTIKEYARTYENRPLLLLTITTPENQSNIDQIKENHHKLIDPDQSGELDLSDMPVIVNMGYSVHGNEASGSNASMLSAYHFTAAEGEEIEEILENTVILIDPSLNPDGLNRFATWVNMHKSNTSVSDPDTREFNEVWPGGRTNHYWFDLNRDWMPVVHPESRGRIQMYHEWRPNILTDHHEMGTNSTFFFQPGIPSRTQPLTPQLNQDLTAAIGEYHADLLDEEQRLYYTKESFDDFYYGKGSTYPDVFGTVGILFEQASARGHAQESENGILEFPFAVKNQFLTSLSTINAAVVLKEDLQDYRRNYYRDVMEEVSDMSTRAIVVGDAYDTGKNFHLADLLSFHNIEMYELNRDLQADGQEFKQGHALVIPTEQTEYKFIESLFEKRTEFSDSLFYDVSTWTLSSAFNMDYAELISNQYSTDLLGEQIISPEQRRGSVIGGQGQYAYVFEWDEYYAPRTLYRLQDLGLKTRVASKPFEVMTADGPKEFSYGSILVPVGIQDMDSDEIFQAVQSSAQTDGVDVYNIERGLATSGIDLGSPSMNSLEKPSVAILGGRGINNLEVGEIWHLLDQRYEIPLTIIDKQRLNSVDMSRYNVLIMTNGRYSDLNSQAASEIKDWVRNGGTLILQRSAIEWARGEDLVNLENIDNEEDENEEPENLAYADLQNARGAQVVGGSIFNGKLDITHPLGYGYRDENIQVFRNSTRFLAKSDNPYATPLYINKDEPLSSGYISDENLEEIGNTASVIVSGNGSGRIISFVDNPNFRAFWYGTNKLFANALFFGNTIQSASTD